MKQTRQGRRQRVLNAADIKRILVRFGHTIAKDYGNTALAFIGVRTRGLTLARRLSGILEAEHDLRVPVGELDTSLYRDDLNTLLPAGRIDETRIQFDINHKTLLLFDDVLNTGRTVRAAVDHLIALGRPRAIFLAVLIDRGGRELPIQADLVGKKLNVAPGADVQVRLREVDKKDEVVVTA